MSMQGKCNDRPNTATRGEIVDNEKVGVTNQLAHPAALSPGREFCCTMQPSCQMTKMCCQHQS